MRYPDDGSKVTVTQLLTLVVSLALPSALLFYNNSKVTDAKEVLRAEAKLGVMEIQNSIADFRREVRSELAEFRREMHAEFSKLETRLHALERHRDN